MLEKKYMEIIRDPHHTSKKHPKMSQIVRAAQFAPFAALTGHDEALQKEAGRSARYYSDKDSIFVTEEELFALDDDIINS